MNISRELEKMDSTQAKETWRRHLGLKRLWPGDE